MPMGNCELVCAVTYAVTIGRIERYYELSKFSLTKETVSVSSIKVVVLIFHCPLYRVQYFLNASPR